MSTAKSIGGSVLQLPDPAENYSLSLLNTNMTNIADEVNLLNKFAKGLVYKNVDTGNSGSIGSSIAVVANLGSFLFKANRQYRIRWDFEFQGSVAGNYLIASIQTCAVTDGAAVTTGLTQLKGKPWKVGDASSISQPGYVEALYSIGADTNLQLKLCFSVAVGAGVVQKTQTSTSPGYFTIEDLGAQL